MVGSDSTGGICTALNVGSANLGAPNCALSADVPTPVAIALGDVNGDGKIDIVAAFETMSPEARPHFSSSIGPFWRVRV
jgi:hypothetical protein